MSIVAKLRLVAVALLLSVSLLPAHAAPLAAPAGDVVLTISGGVAETNGDGEARFDMAMLKALPATEFTTTTIWTDGKIRFTGVLLKDLLAAVGAHGKTVHAVALNDYAIDMPLADAMSGGPLLAYAVNGQPMPVRDKGQLWIVYPYDSDAKYRSELAYSRSIWQLARIEIGD